MLLFMLAWHLPHPQMASSSFLLTLTYIALVDMDREGRLVVEIRPWAMHRNARGKSCYPRVPNPFGYGYHAALRCLLMVHALIHPNWQITVFLFMIAHRPLIV